MEVNRKQSIIHSLKLEKKRSLGSVFILIGGVVVIFLGISTGYWASNGNAISSGISTKRSSDAKQSVGTQDKKTFRDSAEGTIEKGGIDGEGTHKLVRLGGESQTVYLTSSVVDLNQFVGKKVRVWGETFTAQKAGWFMDVGLVEVIE